jgi:hypothetical protein
MTTRNFPVRYARVFGRATPAAIEVAIEIVASAAAVP